MKPYDYAELNASQETDLLQRVRDTVDSVFPGAQIILYGSRARGDAESASDWDFLILVDYVVNRGLVREIRDSLYELELETDSVLSCIVRNTEEWYSGRYSILPFKEIVEREGLVL